MTPQDRDLTINMSGISVSGVGGLGLVAVAGLIAVVLALIVPRLRLTGRRLHRSVRLGWRRAVLDTGPAVSVVVAVALAAGCYTTSRSLADTAMRELRDKADVYVGADLAMTVYDDPAGSAATVIDRWHGATTLVRTGHWRADDASYDLLGVDPATFAAVAATRDRDAAATLRREVRLLQPVPDDEPVPAVVVGRDSDIGAVAVGDVVDVAVVGGRAPISVRIVAKARYFPTSANGAVMYVVDHSVVDRFVQFPVDVLLARDPPPDAPRQLRDAGVRIGKVLDAASVFDGAAYSGLRWSYAPLGVLGVLFGIVALTVQLLVAAGRSASRRATHVEMRRTGFGRRSLVTASAVELGVPLAIGTILGALAAVTASSLAVGRLDPMALLQPPVRYAVPWASLAAVAVAVALWTVAVAFAIARSTVRADPAGVLHGDL